MLSTSIQILKAIHNNPDLYSHQDTVVCYLLRYKFWKLFTTWTCLTIIPTVLYVIYFDTNFESYSQLLACLLGFLCRCMLSTSIQILKAIHNASCCCNTSCAVVCYLLRYKFWKLFTTKEMRICHLGTLYVIYFDTNFESYSQHGSWNIFVKFSCMLSTSIQILKAIHNHVAQASWVARVVCYLLRYKFWKLFTTTNWTTSPNGRLYVIYFDTNFESYSQLKTNCCVTLTRCMLSTSIQILKAIHNHVLRGLHVHHVVCYLFRYKFCSQFDRNYVKDHIRLQNYKKIRKKANLFEKY